jgi:hypothetical protein
MITFTSSVPVSGVSPAAGLKKRPIKSKKKLCSFESFVFGLWERFLTAITRVIVAAPLEKQRDASRGHSHQPLITT